MFGRKFRLRGTILIFAVFPLLLFTQTQEGTSLPSARIAAERIKQYSALAVDWEREYLRIDTTNPPGNEVRSAAFSKRSSIKNKLRTACSTTHRGALISGRACRTAARPPTARLSS